MARKRFACQISDLHPKNLKSLSRKDPQYFSRIEFRMITSDLNYKEHQLKKVRPQGRGRREKGKKEKDPTEKDPQAGHPLYGPSLR